MKLLEEKIREILTMYEALEKRFNIELESSPEGSLLHQMNGGYVEFLHSIPNENGKRERKGINRKPDLIRALAQKEFDRKAQKIISHNIAEYKKALDKQLIFDPDQILKSMKNAYALLPEEYFFDRDNLVIAAGLEGETLARIRSHEEWWKKPYKEYLGHPENKTKRSSRGQMVRSKSELLIVESLYKYGVHFHYEEEFSVGSKIFAPDATFEGAGHKLFYWEHLGMMSNFRYARRNIRKLDDYYDIGLIPGENLILSFDNDDDINMGMIDAIILNEVIPRL